MAEYGRIHTDGSRSGGQPPKPDQVTLPREVVEQQALKNQLAIMLVLRDLAGDSHGILFDPIKSTRQALALLASIGE